jgi:hypothetical protein
MSFILNLSTSQSKIKVVAFYVAHEGSFLEGASIFGGY